MWAWFADLLENGTLRDQLLYPHSTANAQMTDDQLIDIMRSVDLDFVLSRAEDGLETRANWADMLSGGEQQRIGMVRLLYHKPVYAIMVRFSRRPSPRRDRVC